MTARRSHRAPLPAPQGPQGSQGPRGPQAPQADARPPTAEGPGSRPGPRSGSDAAEQVREGPPPGVGRLLWYQTRVLGQPLAVLAHPERGTATTAVELTPASGELLAGVRRYGPPTAPADGGEPPAPVLRQLLDRLSGAGAPFVRLQVLTSSRPPNRTGRVHLVAALPLTPAVVAAARAAGQRRTRDRSGDGLALLAGRATLDLARHLADCGLSLRGFLDATALTELIRSRYDPGPSQLADPAHHAHHLGDPGHHPGDPGDPGEDPGPWAWPAASPWPTEVDATHHRRLRTTSAADGEARAVSWYHATAWVKSWPVSAEGLDLTAPLRLPRLPLPRTVALVLGLDPERTPTAAGYLSVSARTPEELHQLRFELRRMLPAESPLQLEWTDREHHLAFAHTLPLATGLAAAPPVVPAARF
jgi:hypothetical protein